MDGVLLTSRAGRHDDIVERLHAELERRLDAGRVVLDRVPALPGQRAESGRLPDCGVLVVVLDPEHDGGDERLRRGAERAVGEGRAVVPVLVGDGGADAGTEFCGVPVRVLRRDRWAEDLAELVRSVGDALEAEGGARGRARLRARRSRALSASLGGTVAAGVALLPQDDDWVGTGVLPYTFTAAVLCVLALLLPAAWVGVTRVPAGRRARGARRPVSRRDWLFGGHPWLSAGYALCLGLLAGLLAATVLAYVTTGEGTLRRYAALGVLAAVGAGAAAATVEGAYRGRRAAGGER